MAPCRRFARSGGCARRIRIVGFDPVDLGALDRGAITDAPRRAGAVYGEAYIPDAARRIAAAVGAATMPRRRFSPKTTLIQPTPATAEEDF